MLWFADGQVVARDLSNEPPNELPPAGLLVGLDSSEATTSRLVEIEAMLSRVDPTSTPIALWHLGDQPEHLPTRHGFDRYFGIPYSNDMQNQGRGDPPLPLVSFYHRIPF